MSMTDTLCRASKSRDKPYKISDGGGLYLLVGLKGSKLWRHAFRFDGKQKLIALGAYPAVSLADARAGRDANKVLLAKGIDPSAQRKLIAAPPGSHARTRSLLLRMNCLPSSSSKVTIGKRSKKRVGFSAS